MNIVTYSELRQNLKKIMDLSTERHEKVVITRPNGEHMVMLPLKDYESEQETQYLLSTEANRKHIQESLADARAGKVFFKDLLE